MSFVAQACPLPAELLRAGCFALFGGLVACGSGQSDPPDDMPAGGKSSAGLGGSGGDGSSGSGTGGSSPEGGSAGSSGAGQAGSKAALQRHAIASSEYGTCALDAQGLVHCWGAAPGVWKTPSGSFVDIFGGGDKLCARGEDGSFACFSQPIGMPAPIDYAPEGAARELAMHRLAVCAIDEGGAATCGQYATATADLTPPGGQQLEHISVGLNFACGLLAVDGSAVCWGGEGSPTGPDCMGIPASGHLDAPTGSFKRISSGSSSTCAIAEDGSIACWGTGEPADDPEELCGDEPFNFGQSSPPDGSFTSVSANSNHACGVKMDGTVACWGAGTTDDCTLDTGPHCRQSLPPEGKFEQVVTGRNHSCAITSERKVKCWGYNGDPADGRLEPPEVFQ